MARIAPRYVPRSFILILIIIIIFIFSLVLSFCIFGCNRRKRACSPCARPLTESCAQAVPRRSADRPFPRPAADLAPEKRLFKGPDIRKALSGPLFKVFTVSLPGTCPASENLATGPSSRSQSSIPLLPSVRFLLPAAKTGHCQPFAPATKKRQAPVGSLPFWGFTCSGGRSRRSRFPARSPPGLPGCSARPAQKIPGCCGQRPASLLPPPGTGPWA